MNFAFGLVSEKVSQTWFRKPTAEGGTQEIGSILVTRKSLRNGNLNIF